MNEQYNLDNEQVLKILPFYNVLIDFVKRDVVKGYCNVKFMSELPFYKDLSVEKINEEFKRYAKSYRVEIVDKKDPMIQLYSSKGRIIKLFGELLSGMKGFQYQITLFVTLKKSKLDGTVEYAAVYLNSFVKTVTNYGFEDSISEILFRLDNWINEGSGWVIERVNDQYLNISQYSPLVGSSFIELPGELRNSKKGLINLRKSYNKCFMWCHVRHLHPVSDNASRIKTVDKKIASTLDYSEVKFPVKVKDVSVIEDMNEICINVFSYEDKIVCPVYVSKKKYGDCMNLLINHEDDKSHDVYVKDFNRLMFNASNLKDKKWFCMRCLQHFSSKIILEKHKDDCVVVNGEQNR